MAAPIAVTTVKDMPGITAPVGYFDPVGYSEQVSPEAMLWFRAAELKVSLRVLRWGGSKAGAVCLFSFNSVA